MAMNAPLKASTLPAEGKGAELAQITLDENRLRDERRPTGAKRVGVRGRLNLFQAADRQASGIELAVAIDFDLQALQLGQRAVARADLYGEGDLHGAGVSAAQQAECKRAVNVTRTSGP